MIGATGMRGATGAGANNMTGTALMGGNKIPKGYRSGQLQQFTPEQMQLFKQLFSNVGPDSFLSRLAGGDEGLFNQLEAPALRQFNSLQGNLASRFSGAGMGARKSSGFQNASNQAASDFAQQLQSQRMGLQQQAIRDLMGMGNDLLSQRPYSQFLVEKQRGGGWGGPIGAGLGAVGGFFAGGPAGALAGGRLGYDVGSSF